MTTDRFGDAGRVDQDRLYGTLAGADRRAVVEYFHATAAETASVEELARHLAAHSERFEDRERATVRLHHATLPKLADAGIVHYDPDGKTVDYYGHPILEELATDARWTLNAVL